MDTEHQDMINRIDTILNKQTECLCSFWESCESCSSDSSYNRLRKEIREAVHGPDPVPTLEDYGKFIVLTHEELFGKDA